MQFTLSDEQTLLRDSARRFIDERHGFGEARSAAANPLGFEPAHWRLFAELGWLALLIPQEDGGIGGDAQDAALVLEEFGRGLVAAPFLSSAVLSAGLIGSASAAFPAKATLLARIASGEALLSLACEEAASRYGVSRPEARAVREGSDLILTGRKIVVLDGVSATDFLVTGTVPGPDGAARLAILHVPADTRGLGLRHYRTIDGRRASDLSIDRVRVGADAVVASGPEALAALEGVLDRVRVLLAAEAVGAMAAAIALTAEHLKVRQQFGRSLASFQTLAHRLSEMFVKLENARSMVYRGLAMLDAPADERAAAVSATMMASSQAAEFVCGQAIQLHGGIGMADENAVGDYYKRIRAIGKTYGDASWHMRRYIALTGACKAVGVR